jgi:hypothetical protein
MTGRALGHAWPQLAKTGPRMITDGHMMPICVARYLVGNSVFVQLLILLVITALHDCVCGVAVVGCMTSIVSSPHCMRASVVSPSWVA